MREEWILIEVLHEDRNSHCTISSISEHSGDSM